MENLCIGMKAELLADRLRENESILLSLIQLIGVVNRIEDLVKYSFVIH